MMRNIVQARMDHYVHLEELAGTYQGIDAQTMKTGCLNLRCSLLQRRLNGQYSLSFPVAVGYSALRYSSVMVTVRLKDRASGDRLSNSGVFGPTPE